MLNRHALLLLAVVLTQGCTTPVPSGLDREGLASVAFFDANHGIAIGRVDGTDVSNVAVTEDGGISWRSGGRTIGGVVFGASVVPGTSSPTLVSVSPETVNQYFTDGGLTWIEISGDRFWTVSFLNATTGWAGCRSSQPTTLEQRQALVAQKGAEVMPFDLDATTHTFKKTAEGGVQQVVADADDPQKVRLIRVHLQTISTQFAAGNFHDPTMIHGPEMACLHRSNLPKPRPAQYPFKSSNRSNPGPCG